MPTLICVPTSTENLVNNLMDKFHLRANTHNGMEWELEIKKALMVLADPNAIEVTFSPESTQADREQAFKEIRDGREREERRHQRWGSDYKKAMSALANLFPTMRGVPGTSPWDVDLLIKWMNGPAPTSGSWNAAMFLLGVWSPTQNWKECGLKISKGRQGRFDFHRAFSCWDQQHINAFTEWFQNPFWP